MEYISLERNLGRRSQRNRGIGKKINEVIKEEADNNGIQKKTG